MIAYAASTDAAKSLLAKIEDVILFPLMTLMVSVALMLFLWGAYEYVANAESDSAHETGRTHMIYGILGLVVMLSALTLLKIAAGTFGVTIPE